MPPKKEASSTTAGSSSGNATQPPPVSVGDAAAAEQKQALFLANAKLCRLVKRCTWMYDRQHPNYAKKHIMDKSWTKIAKECDDSVASCKERWRNIRAAFARSINIYKTNSGPNRVKPYYLYNELQFLIKPMMDGREMTNKEIDEIKADWDDTITTLPPDAEKSTCVTPTEEQSAEPMSDVEADLSFPDDDSALVNILMEASSSDCNTTINNECGNNNMHSNNMTINNSMSDNNMPNNNMTTNNSMSSSNASINKLPTPNINTNQTTSNNIGQPLNVHSNIELQYTPNPKRPRISHDFGNDLSNSNDPDAKFLEALLPDMRAMNTRQKIIFKRKIYQSLEEVFDTNTDFPAMRTNASAVATTTQSCNAAQSATHGITGLRKSEVKRVQDFLQTILRQRGACERPLNGQTLTIIPRVPSQQPSAARGGNASTSRSATVANNGGKWEQVHPMTVKYELLDDDEGDDVNDFE